MGRQRSCAKGLIDQHACLISVPFRLVSTNEQTDGTKHGTAYPSPLESINESTRRYRDLQKLDSMVQSQLAAEEYGRFFGEGSECGFPRGKHDNSGERVLQLSRYLGALFQRHGGAISSSAQNSLFKDDGDGDSSEVVRFLFGPPPSAQKRVDLHEDPVVQLKVCG